MFLKNKIKKLLATNTKKNIIDTYALVQLAPLNLNYNIWTSSSIRSSAMVKILNEIIINKKKIVMEFGSGLSSVYIAKILKKIGGKLYSVEDDKNWINTVKNMLEDSGVEEYVHFIHAPLKTCKYALHNLNWYDEDIISNFKIVDKLDLVLIDGPIAYKRNIRLSRYPAVPVLHHNNKLKDSTTIILDDINRSGEEKILKLWEQEFNIKFNRHYADGGIAIKINKDSYNI